jgi:hypothetical protein
MKGVPASIRQKDVRTAAGLLVGSKQIMTNFGVVFTGPGRRQSELDAVHTTHGEADSKTRARLET